MKLLWSIGSYFALCALGCLLQIAPAIMQAAPAAQLAAQPPHPAQHDGQHDFDFNLGTWHTHIKRLGHPLGGSNAWVEMQGTVVVRKVWDAAPSWKKSKPTAPMAISKASRYFSTMPKRISGARFSLTARTAR